MNQHYKLDIFYLLCPMDTRTTERLERRPTTSTDIAERAPFMVYVLHSFCHPSGLFWVPCGDVIVMSRFVFTS